MQGLRLLRPEKSWRPIITVDVDNHHCYESVMGIDGQNPNQKERFYLHQAHTSSTLDIRVWHRSSSKKKKKRNLVASATHSLGELLRRVDKDPRAALEIRLQCQSASTTKRRRANSGSTTTSKGKLQGGVMVLLRIRPPTTLPSGSSTTSSHEGESGESGMSDSDEEAESS
ncbi:hypothetical protein DXG03_005270, partial [Asterophora parasitica]